MPLLLISGYREAPLGDENGCHFMFGFHKLASGYREAPLGDENIFVTVSG